MEKSIFVREFEEFGSKMYILAILSVISIFTSGIIQLVMFIILLISLKHIKDANQELNNEKLDKFRKYIIYSVIIGIIGGIVIITILSVVAVIFLQVFPGFVYIASFTVADFQQLVPLIITLLLVLLVGGFSVGIISLGFLYTAWKSLNLFLENNSGLFPDFIANKAIDGSGKIRKAYMLSLVNLIIGAILVLVLILSFPLIQLIVIPLIEQTVPPVGLIVGFGAVFGILGIIMGIIGLISFILMILGYFSLSDLRKL
ncbi:MAG: hypothetical protein P8Y70_01140 [Candidatus Lokiarchaeota archaeon]